MAFVISYFLVLGKYKAVEEKPFNGVFLALIEFNICNYLKKNLP